MTNLLGGLVGPKKDVIFMWSDEPFGRELYNASCGDDGEESSRLRITICSALQE
jgi:hypothetical protein